MQEYNSITLGCTNNNNKKILQVDLLFRTIVTPDFSLNVQLNGILIALVCIFTYKLQI